MLKRERKKVIRSRRKAVPVHHRAVKRALKQLKGLAGKFNESRTLITSRILSKLDTTTLTRLQKALEKRNCNVDSLLARAILKAQGNREYHEARRVVKLPVTPLPSISRRAPRAVRVALRAEPDAISFDTKLNALRYQRSARRMSKLDHQIVGYSYRFPLVARRVSSPRFEGVPLPRK